MNLCHPLNSSSSHDGPDDGPGYRVVKGTVVIIRPIVRSPPGRSITVRLYSSTQLDSKTGKAKLSSESSLKGKKKTKNGKIRTLIYPVTFHLDDDFGTPGAIVVKNGNINEFFLKFVSLEVSEDWKIHFDCNSWIYPFNITHLDRVFFSNTSYLPSRTPKLLKKLREEELVNLRGTGEGERKHWERVYDYDYYNDLGSPEQGNDYIRPVLGGTDSYPYPRRCRTGRPLSKTDVTETEKGGKFLNLDGYVPPDDRFSQEKFSEFIAGAIQAMIHFHVPEVKSVSEGAINNFGSFEQLKRDLYSKTPKMAGFKTQAMGKLKTLIPDELYRDVKKKMKGNPAKFAIPQVIAANENAWRTDKEFAREMLAGPNPTVIKCLKNIEDFPPKGSSIAADDIKDKLEGLSVQSAIDQRRIFILDHHDYLMPYLKQINSQKGVCAYASRTLLFLKANATLKPLVIELSLPEETSRVFKPESPELWQLAKTFVAVNDTSYHQLISHWLYTHATVEPFVIAMRRQLSTMHPIYKLLDPHLKDTLHINALARSILLNAGGVLESTIFPGKYAMELSSKIYADWKFTKQALPEDLIERGFAFKDPNQPSELAFRDPNPPSERASSDPNQPSRVSILLIKDYPYANDGLDVWFAIEKWVHNYCTIFYCDDQAVNSDLELRSWYTEIREKGHGDKHDDQDCWPELNTIKNLTRTLTTLIWIASALHASINFGQFAYAGYPPNRPTRCRKFIPFENTQEFSELAKDPEKFYFNMIPDRFTTTLGITLIEVLSHHLSDEVYLGQRASERWTNNGEILRLFHEFSDDLKSVEKKIKERNKDTKLKNRTGPAKVPYMLMYPDTSNTGREKGMTGKGIPNSVSA